jgi:hypothetical protein
MGSARLTVLLLLKLPRIFVGNSSLVALCVKQFDFGSFEFTNQKRYR